MLEKGNKIIEKLCRATALISGGVALVMVVMITADVLSRNLLNRPIVGVYEITQYVCMPLTVLPALSYAYYAGLLPKFELVKESHSTWLKWLTTILSAVVEIAVFVMMAWGAWRFASNGLVNRDATYSGTKMFPIWPFYWLSPIGFTALAITVIYTYIGRFYRLIREEKTTAAREAGAEEERKEE